MTNLRVAVVIADSYGEPFESLKAQIQPKIWNFDNRPDIFYVRGFEPNKVQTILNKFTDSFRYSKLWPLQRCFDQIQIKLRSKKKIKFQLDGSDFNLELAEGLRYLGLKVLTTLEFLYEKEYDVVYKTTLSSIVNEKNFQQEISRIDQDKPYYGGTLVNFGSHPFVSGANLLLNRKSIEILLKSKNKWNHGLLDDVSIGRILEGKVAITEISSMNISDLNDLKKLSDESIKNLTHYRCKSAKVIRNDVEILSELKKRLTNGQ